MTPEQEKTFIDLHYRMCRAYEKSNCDDEARSCALELREMIKLHGADRVPSRVFSDLEHVEKRLK